MKKRMIVFYLILGFLICIFDRFAKSYVLSNCTSKCVVNRFLSFEVIFNRGISWGVFHSASDIVFILVTITITLITIFLAGYAYVRFQHGLTVFGEVLVFTGSFSNLIDRVVYSGVIDFIVLSYNGWSWPVFNIADSVIVFGIGIMVIQGVLESRAQKI